MGTLRKYLSTPDIGGTIDLSNFGCRLYRKLYVLPWNKMISGILVLGLLSLADASVPSDQQGFGSPYDEPFEERPQPYSFNIDVKDEYGNTLRRQEVGDDLGNKKGSYGYTDAFGISRQVEYIADDKGFRAVVKTNEPGTDNQNPADVEIISNAVQVPPSYESQPLSDPAFGRPRSPPPPPPPPINEQPIHPVYSAPAPIGAPTNGYGPVPGPAPATLDRAPLY